MFKRLLNILLFQAEDGEIVNTGAIVWGVLLRVFIYILTASVLIPMYNLYQYWYVSLFIVWLFAFYPAYNKYNEFQAKMKEFQEDTLCGNCIHFNRDSQLCNLFDEHVTEDYIPCEGLNWEPKSYQV